MNLSSSRTETFQEGAGRPAAAAVTANGALEVGGLLADRFRIRRVLGEGGSGTVYAAFDEALGQPVALKVFHGSLIHDDSVARLRREVQAARGGHPGLVSVYDLHQADGLWFLSMELVEGCSLRSLLGQRGHLGVEETAAIGRQVADALADLHRRGLVHRDVKPGNVLVTPGGTAKLCDLGLVRSLEHGETVTQEAVYVGTPAYMAPEQVLLGHAGEESDVYALGLTLLQCLTGTAPVLANTPVATAIKRQRARPPKARPACADCPPWLDRLLGRMLEPSPRERPRAQEVARVLGSGKLRPRMRRSTALRLAVAGLAVAAVTIGARAWWTSRTVRFEVSERSVGGVDRNGRATWRHEFESQVRQVERADVDGDGEEELVAVAYPPDTAESGGTARLPRSELLVVRRTGSVVTSIRPEDLVVDWHHPFAKRFKGSVALLDLDGDRAREVVLNCKHQTFYPDELLVYWPRQDAWQWVLDHTGYLYALAPVPGAAPPSLRFFAVNNRLGFLPVVGEITLVPPPGSAKNLESPGTLRVADGTSGVGASSSLTLYVPLPPDRLGAFQSALSLEITADGGTAVHSSSITRLDPHGNPVPGPNAGHDLRAMRLELMARLAQLPPSARLQGVGDVTEKLGVIESRMAPILAEAPTRAAVGVVGALALATASDLPAAIDLLQRTAQVAPYEDVLYRLAHLEAVGGKTSAAVARLLPVAEKSVTGRGSYDAPHLLLRLAIERRDEALFERALALLCGHSGYLTWQAGLPSALRARAHLWWDEAGEPDRTVRSWPYSPEGDAIASLARWRAGLATEDDVRLMAKLAEAAPDAAPEARIAQAAALMTRGRANEALVLLDPLVMALERDARADFSALQLFQLASAMHANALVAVGATQRAHAEAKHLLERATPGLLPAILASEALAPAGSPLPLWHRR